MGASVSGSGMPGLELLAVGVVDVAGATAFSRESGVIALGGDVGVHVIELEDAGVEDAAAGVGNDVAGVGNDVAGVGLVGTNTDQGSSALSCLVSRSMSGSEMGESETGIRS